MKPKSLKTFLLNYKRKWVNIGSTRSKVRTHRLMWFGFCVCDIDVTRCTDLKECFRAMLVFLRFTVEVATWVGWDGVR